MIVTVLNIFLKLLGKLSDTFLVVSPYKILKNYRMSINHYTIFYKYYYLQPAKDLLMYS